MLDFKLSVNNSWQLCILFCLTAAVFLAPDIASATSTTNDGISQVLCLIVTKLTGPIGKAAGMIGLVALGIGIFLGKLNWPLALSIALGITFIFSASTIIGWLTGTASNSCGY